MNKIKISTSTDQSLIGISVDFIKEKINLRSKKIYFQFPSCTEGGKFPLLKDVDDLSTFIDYKEINREIAQVIGVNPKLVPPINKDSDILNGSDIFDTINKLDEPLFKEQKLQRFLPKLDYHKIKISEKSRPWKGKSILTEDEAKKVADIVLDHFYDGMVQNLLNKDDNLNAQKTPAENPQWCHMPWLNIGNSRREFVHGLTKERDIEPSPIFPNAGKTPETQGTDWGIGYFNDIGCSTINKVFGNTSKFLPIANFNLAQFEDGAASIKVLFTTAQLPEQKNSFSWYANVSLPGFNVRRLQQIRLIQIDVAIKDSTVRGTDPRANNWFMMTYYFDNTYNYTYTSQKRLRNTAVESLLKMRPVGVQFGFTNKESIIFNGAFTNNANGLLNGPADNSKASCLSCHGVAGSSFKMVPGIQSFDDFVKKVGFGGLDFSQQFALARRNYETQPNK